MSANVSIQNLKSSREGAYRTGAKSGLITTIAAGDATNGHVWAARWAPDVTNTPAAMRRAALIQRLRVRCFTIAGFTAAQEFSLALFKLTGYTAAHSAGTALAPTKKRVAHPAPLMTGQIALAVQLTAGTQVIAAEPIAVGVSSELAAAATVQKGVIDMFLSTEDLAEYPIVLAPNEGLLLRNEIVMGAVGTARLVVEMDWLELERY